MFDYMNNYYYHVNSQAAVIAMMSYYGAATLANIVLHIIYRGSSYYSQMISSCLLEILGFSGYYYAYTEGNVTQTLGARLAVNFLMTAICFTFADTMRVCGQRYSVLRPKKLKQIFACVTVVVFALVLIPSVCTVHSDSAIAVDVRRYTSLAAMAILVVSILAFLGLAAVYFLRVKEAVAANVYQAVKETSVNFKLFGQVRQDRYFLAYVVSYLVATLLVFIGTFYDFVSLCEGINDVYALDVEPMTLMTAVFLMTVFSPGPALKRKQAIRNSGRGVFEVYSEQD